MLLAHVNNIYNKHLPHFKHTCSSRQLLIGFVFNKMGKYIIGSDVLILECYLYIISTSRYKDNVQESKLAMMTIYEFIVS